MFRVETTGGNAFGGSGSTPDELYGLGVWGPAIYGERDVTNVGAVQASTFAALEVARCCAASCAISGNLVRVFDDVLGQVVSQT